MSTRLRIRTLLRHYLPRYGEPPREQLTAAVDHVWQTLEHHVTRTSETSSASAFLGRRSSQSEGGRRKPRALQTRWIPLAAAVVVVIAAIGTAIVWHPADNALFRVVEGDVHRQGETIRSNGGGAGAVLKLTDGSRVEMRSQSELSLERANDGLRIRLIRGGIIVDAATQRTGHLYVQTKEVTISVVGTVFLVNADERGSQVAVIEGEVRVQQGTTEKKLLPGEQVATSPTMARGSIKEEIAWARNAPLLVGLLQQSTVTASPVRPAVDVSPQAREAFEVVSIRLAPPLFGGARDGSPPGTPAPARVASGAPCIGLDLQLDARRYATRSIPVLGLITYAYGRTCQTTDQIIGGPAWVRVDGYDIDATLPMGSPSYTAMHLRRGAAPRLQRMLQTMLEDRFNLVLRREMREMAVYNLVMATPGKVTPSADQQNAPDRAAMTISKPPVGPIGPGIGAPWTTMAMFASSLQRYLGRPVIDKTELKGRFDIVLDFPELAGAGQGGAVDVTPLIAERLPRRMEELLGLRLEPSRGLVEVLIIEQVDRPTEN